MLLGLLVWLSGCATVGYYAQSISGHMEIMSRSQAIEGIVNEQGPDGQLEQRLQLALAARRYASEALGLPNNDSYKTYADINRPYAVWNVIATPAFSIEPKQWCFLFVGCIQYRGYFDRQAAEAYAAELADEGYDVYIAGARAYSTLGWFDDPLLNTMVFQSEARLVGVIFHELAHQRLYVKGDSAFNEAFATTVEREGVRRWFRQRPEPFQAYMRRESRQRAFHDLLLETRARLAELYARNLPDPQTRQRKRQLFDNLRERYASWKRRFDYDGYDQWMRQPLNNAHLALVATYNDLVPHFQALLGQLDNDLAAFYAVVERYARQPKARRHRQLRRFTAKGTRYELDTTLESHH